MQTPRPGLGVDDLQVVGKPGVCPSLWRLTRFIFVPGELGENTSAPLDAYALLALSFQLSFPKSSARLGQRQYSHSGFARSLCLRMPLAALRVVGRFTVRNLRHVPARHFVAQFRCVYGRQQRI